MSLVSGAGDIHRRCVLCRHSQDAVDGGVQTPGWSGQPWVCCPLPPKTVALPPQRKRYMSMTARRVPMVNAAS